jgi:type II secretory pathway predicted ATPase ExeA
MTKSTPISSVEQFFGFKDQPFRITPDTKLFFSSQSVIKANRLLTEFLALNEGVFLISSEPGAGKTSFLKRLSELHSTQYRFVYLQCYPFTANELFEAIAFALKLRPSEDKAKTLQLITLYIRRLRKEGNKVVFLLDEANALSDEALYELGLFSGAQHQNEHLLQMVLAGSQDLMKRLKAGRCHYLLDKVVLSTELKPLMPIEIQPYIDYRLRSLSDEPPTLVTAKTAEYLYKFSQGNPRLLNIICFRLLLEGAEAEKKNPSLLDFHTVIHSMHQEGLLPRKQDGR